MNDNDNTINSNDKVDLGVDRVEVLKIPAEKKADPVILIPFAETVSSKRVQIMDAFNKNKDLLLGRPVSTDELNSNDIGQSRPIVVDCNTLFPITEVGTPDISAGEKHLLTEINLPFHLQSVDSSSKVVNLTRHKIRKSFDPLFPKTKDMVDLVDYDYSQIELKVLAKFEQEFMESVGDPDRIIYIEWFPSMEAAKEVVDVMNKYAKPNVKYHAHVDMEGTFKVSKLIWYAESEDSDNN